MFNKKIQGDFILQSDDKTSYCFYFPSALLCALSSFFSGLPPPSPRDLVDGRPLIPLQDTPSPALALALLALKSLSDPISFNLTSSQYRDHGLSKPKSDTFIEAAVFGKRYDIPVLYRLLLEATSLLKRDDALFLEFCIWSVSDVENPLNDAVRDTIDLDISEASNATVSAMRKHAPEYWSKLQAFHLRRANGVRRLHKALVNRGTGISADGEEDDDDEECDECGHDPGIIEIQIRAHLLETKTIPDIFTVWYSDFDLECSECTAEMRGRYRPLMTWFEGFTKDWDYSKSYSDPKR